MSEETKLDEFHYHEVMDRAYVLMEAVENALLEHPAVAAHSHLRGLVSEAHDRLYDVYQAAGVFRFPEKDEHSAAVEKE